MANAKAYATVLIALTIAATLFAPISTMINDSTGVQSVTNESLTADPGTWQELDGYQVEQGSETVWWYNSTSSSWEQLSGSDYDVRYDPGELKVNTSSSVQEGDDLKVSYDYQATSETSTTVLTMVPLFVALLMLGVLASKIMQGM